MWLRRDERGQAIQVGAALLLGFLVIAMTLYQLQVVPAQNAEIEFDHSQQVQGEVQELRNAVADAGSSDTTQSRSVQLGTRYPARTFFVNPPPARGVLRTESAGSVSVSNAQLAPDAAFGDDAGDLLDSAHPTARVVYEPDYNEYGGEPTTVVEHAMAYNVYADDDGAGLSSQPVVRGSRLRVTLLAGELDEQGADSVPVEARTISGPTDPIPVVPEDDSAPIELRLGVLHPAPWNDSIGTAYDEGQDGARVAAYDPDDGQLTVELDGDRYELRLALVGVGQETRESDRFDVTATTDGDAAYDVAWTDPSGQSGVEDGSCDADRCVVTGSSVDLSVATAPVADGAAVEYAVSNATVGTVSPASDQTDAAGEDTTTFDVDAAAADGDTVQVYASSGGDGDRILLEIDRS